MARHQVFDGRVRGGTTGAGVVHPEFDNVMFEYHQLNTDEAKGAFADKLVRNLSIRLSETWPVLYRLLGIIRDRKVYEDARLVADGKTYTGFKEYFEEVMGYPFDRWAEMEQTYHFVATFKPELLLASYDVARRAAQELAADPEVKPQPTLGEAMREVSASQPRNEDGTFGKREEPSGSITTARKQERGAEYLVRRLKRDAPEIAQALADGKYPSARAAAIAAGIIVLPTPLDLLRKAWKKASSAEKATFLEEANQEGF